jgi:hypothetical protein
MNLNVSTKQPFHCCSKLENVMHQSDNESATFITAVVQVVASQDCPVVTKYVGLVSLQSQNEELIEDIYINS